MSSRQEYCKTGAKSRSSNQHLLFILYSSGIWSRTTKIWLTSKYQILWYNGLPKDMLGLCDFAERIGCNSELSTLRLLFSMSRQLWDTTIVSFSYNNLVRWIDCGLFSLQDDIVSHHYAAKTIENIVATNTDMSQVMIDVENVETGLLVWTS